jgi:hypothetical protein
MKQWWEQQALPWLKKYGPWIIFPLGLLLLAVKVLAGTRTQVVSSGFSEAAAASADADEEATQKIEASTAHRDKSVAEIHEVYTKATGALVAKQTAGVTELLEDPEDLNKFLLDVGRQVRDEDS